MTDEEQSTPKISFAEAGEDGRLHAPSAERNVDAILQVLRAHAPSEGKALEIASGTGQHIVHFARQLPELDWQPSEVNPARIESIRIWREKAGLANLREPVTLDATHPGWSVRHGGQILIMLSNLMHLIDTSSAQTLISESAQALAPLGRLMIYGPFFRDGRATSDGDSRFHAKIVQEHPTFGYKNDADMLGWLRETGLHIVETLAMPANNLTFIAERPDDK
ncbi:MAG: DUF938 domain-containing protein [Pseudomonadota bacterium]